MFSVGHCHFWEGRGGRKKGRERKRKKERKGKKKREKKREKSRVTRVTCVSSVRGFI